LLAGLRFQGLPPAVGTISGAAVELEIGVGSSWVLGILLIVGTSVDGGSTVVGVVSSTVAGSTVAGSTVDVVLISEGEVDSTEVVLIMVGTLVPDAIRFSS
jgi:hypothetical protein